MDSSRPRAPDVHLNLRIRGMPPSATVAVNELCDSLRRQGRRVFKLGLGQSPFPVPRPVVEALQRNAHQKDYLPVKGLPALREEVSRYHERTQEIRRTGDDVLIGPGSKELMFLLQLVYYGDLVVPTPTWVSYAPQAHIIGRQVRWVQTDREERWCLSPDRLQDLCRDDPSRPRVVVLNYPSNPTGGTYRSDELQDLAAVARENRVVLLADEIYGELQFEGAHTSIARYYPEGTIVSSGLSKWCGAGGWRLGTFIFPPGLRWLLAAMAAAASETFTSTSAPIQHAAVAAFSGGLELDRYLHDSRRVLGALGRWCAARLQEAGVRVTPPQGAFYVFPDFTPLQESLRARGVTDSPSLCSRLLEETGVAILPGSAFGRPPRELTARLALVDFDGAAALEAAQALPGEEELDESFLRAYCGDVVEALERLTGWLSRLGPAAPAEQPVR